MGRRRYLVTRRQKRYLSDLAARAGVEEPRVIWSHEARDAIRKLERYIAATEFGHQEQLL